MCNQREGRRRGSRLVFISSQPGLSLWEGSLGYLLMPVTKRKCPAGKTHQQGLGSDILTWHLANHKIHILYVSEKGKTFKTGNWTRKLSTGPPRAIKKNNKIKCSQKQDDKELYLNGELETGQVQGTLYEELCHSWPWGPKAGNLNFRSGFLAFWITSASKVCRDRSMTSVQMCIEEQKCMPAVTRGPLRDPSWKLRTRWGRGQHRNPGPQPNGISQVAHGGRVGERSWGLCRPSTVGPLLWFPSFQSADKCSPI